MKKLCVLLLLLSLLLGCVGCGADHGEGNTTPIATDPPAETTPTVTEPPLDTTPAGSEPPEDTTPVESTPSIGPFHPRPPLAWHFDSYEELRELREMSEADEATLREYISVHYPSSTDIFAGDPKNAIIELFDSIGNWYLPYVDPSTGYFLFYISYYPREDNPNGKYFSIGYHNGKSMVQFSGPLKKSGNNVVGDDRPVAFTMSIDGQMISVYGPSVAPAFNYSCTFYYEGMKFSAQFSEPNAATIKNAFDGKIEFLTLNELMGY